jgi:hypothetical protein
VKHVDLPGQYANPIGHSYPGGGVGYAGTKSIELGDGVGRFVGAEVGSFVGEGVGASVGLFVGLDVGV